MVVEGDGATAAIRPPDREVLAQVAIVLGPELVLSAIAVMVAVERMGCVVGRIVRGEGIHNIEFYARIAGEAIES